MKLNYLKSLLLGIILNSCNSMKEADLIVQNAVIYTVDSSFSIAESFAVKDGRIVAIGKNEDIGKEYRSGNILDLNGQPVYPGFIDPHCHFLGYGLSLNEVDLTGTKSFNEVAGRVKIHANETNSYWIIGRGWDQNDWADKTFPDKSMLDTHFPDRPVVLYRIDGHAALINSKAIELASIANQTNVEGGEVVEENGEPTGILIDNAVNLIKKIIPMPSPNEIEQGLLEAQEKCFAVGLTSVHDAGLDAGEINIIDSLQKGGKLNIRIFAMLNPSGENFDAYLRKGKYKTDKLNVSSIKLYADGALGSRGARLIEPYSDDPSTNGLFISSAEFLREMSLLADSAGYQVCTHCIGDGANREILQLYGEILKEKNDKRWRIEHAQIVHPDDIPLFGEFSIIPSIQSTHATSDMYWAEDRLGKRIAYAYPYHRLLGQNGWLPNGSDFPIESINPILGFYAAFTRQDLSGYPEGGFQPDDSLSREEAIKAMTIWAAKSAFEENEKGSLETGKFADFVILDRDIMEVAPSEVKNARVTNCYVDGKKVY